jgi:hypothetical protein
MGGFKSTSRAWLSEESKVLKRAEEVMAGVIVSRGTILAHKKSGELRDSGRIEKQGGVTSAVFGGNGVPYGRIQELGGTIKPKKAKALSWIGPDGERVYAKSVKIKGVHYLKRAGDSVKKENPKKYVDMSR